MGIPFSREIQNTYEILGEIGAGGTGTIYKAYHRNLRKYVVFKKMNIDVANMVNIRAEADILKNLRHSYLPQVFDFIQTPEAVYTVMDFIPGESIESLLAKGYRFGQKQAVKYAKQICEAVSYLHEQKVPIIHGDIKPGNIMLTPEDNICVIDFNISGFMSEEGGDVNGCSPGYAAPELYYAVWQRRQGQYVPLQLDKRMDIYSIGATLYQMLTGIKPDVDFQKNVPLQSMELGLTDTFAAVIDRAMNPDPESRFADAPEMLDALNSLAKRDKRYRSVVHQQYALSFLCLLGIVASVGAIFGGRVKMVREKEEAYFECIDRMEEAGNAGDEEAWEELYQQCMEMYPDRGEIYYQAALYRYHQQKYEETIQYIDDQALNKAKNVTPEIEGNFYYIRGDCYLELEQYDKAVDSFRTAVRAYEANSAYYRDYAIALAKNGEVDKSEEILDEAVKKGLSDDSVLLTRGEIGVARHDDKTAEENLRECIKITGDDYVRFRAYVRLGELYSEGAEDSEHLEKAEAVFEEAKDAVAREQKALILEKLVGTQISLYDMTEDVIWQKKALETLAEIEKNGWDSYNTHNNMAVMYEKAGDLDEAEQELKRMLEEYGDHYNTYKRLCVLEMDKQNQKEAEARDYTMFAEYYGKAKELFEQSGNTADSDMEMAVLAENYRQLKDRKWIP